MKRNLNFLNRVILLFLLQFFQTVTGLTQTVSFAVITDYGYSGNSTVTNVANMVNRWNPEFIVTAGDNSQGTTCNTGCYAGVVGAYYGPEAVSASRTDFITSGKFFPVPGNHDYFAPISNYSGYFNNLPPAGASTGATALYYDFVWGPVHFFMLNSGQSDNSDMPDQNLQQTFLQNGLAASTAAWKIVMFHRPPYTSGTYHSSDTHLQWPFETWGADLVITGHNHIYERIYKNEGELRYITAGTAGSDPRNGNTSFSGMEAYYFGTESGAIKVNASATSITLQYTTINAAGTEETIRDTYTRSKEASDDPVVNTSVSTLPVFSSQPGIPSSTKDYTVSGVKLKGNVTITPPAGFEISTSADQGFSTVPVVLSPVDGTLAATTLYVRLNLPEAGSPGGVISHVSSEAITRNVAVEGNVNELTSSSTWTSYNDMAGTSTPAYTTEYGLSGTGGMLTNFENGNETGVTVSLTSQGSPYTYTDGGSMPLQGTDAYTIFNGKVNLQGVIMSATSNPADYWVDVTFNNLNPDATYTFAATANRDGTESGDPPYNERFTRYTISGMDVAVNASSAGVGIYDGEGHSVYFCTGYNTEKGYVAKWVGIQPGSDGSFTVRAQPQDPQFPRTYAFGAFMLAADEPDIPLIHISGNMISFKTEPGIPSAAQTYSVTASNLEDDMLVTAPAGFELSTDGMEYASQLTLTRSGSSVSATVYVRLTGSGEGSYSGDITHSSQGADAKNLPVNGSVMPSIPWIAYNDLVLMSGQPSSNITSYSIPGDSRVSSGLLKDYHTGENTEVSVAVTVNGSPQYQDYTGEYSGTEAATGTDAYTAFHGIANSSGLIQYGSSDGWWVDLTFTGLDPAKTYSFATTANRNDNSYTDRITKFTLSGVDGASNGSTSGVTINNNESVQFCTGYNTVNGYVARWSAIKPGADGSFKVRAEQGTDEHRAYAFSVFVLNEEVGSQAQINVSGSLTPFASHPGIPSVAQSISISGNSLSDPIVLTAPAGFELSADGTLFSGSLSLTPVDGIVQATAVYVRLNSSTANSFSGNITIESSGVELVTLPVTGTVTPVTGAVLGDINGDGLANSTDALIILSCDAGIDVSLFCPMNAGDVNGDGMVNSTDALIILSKDAGIAVPFPVGQQVPIPVNVSPCAGCNP